MQLFDGPKMRLSPYGINPFILGQWSTHSRQVPNILTFCARFYSLFINMLYLFSNSSLYIWPREQVHTCIFHWAIINTTG